MPRTRNNSSRSSRAARIIAAARAIRSPEQRELDNANNRERMRIQRQAINFERLAFAYDPNINYSAHRNVSIGLMDKVCRHCSALKYAGETVGLCCSDGKVRLPQLANPPEPLYSLLSGTTTRSNQFLNKLRTYNSAFNMTSFGASEIRPRRGQFDYTFQVNNHDEECKKIFCGKNDSDSVMNNNLQIQGQIYHQMGALLPAVNQEYRFLQVYFLENNSQVDRRVNLFENLKWEMKQCLLMMMI